MIMQSSTNKTNNQNTKTKTNNQNTKNKTNNQNTKNKTNNQNTKLTKPVRTHYGLCAYSPWGRVPRSPRTTRPEKTYSICLVRAPHSPVT